MICINESAAETARIPALAAEIVITRQRVAEVAALQTAAVASQGIYSDFFFGFEGFGEIIMAFSGFVFGWHCPVANCQPFKSFFLLISFLEEEMMERVFLWAVLELIRAASFGQVWVVPLVASARPTAVCCLSCQFPFFGGGMLGAGRCFGPACS